MSYPAIFFLKKRIFSKFLSLFSDPSLALSSSRQLSNESTAIMRVSRSSDNAESDFSANEVANGTLLSWVGTGGTDNGLVPIWYDQRVPTSYNLMWYDGVDDKQSFNIDEITLNDLDIEITAKNEMDSSPADRRLIEFNALNRIFWNGANSFGFRRGNSTIRTTYVNPELVDFHITVNGDLLVVTANGTEIINESFTTTEATSTSSIYVGGREEDNTLQYQGVIGNIVINEQEITMKSGTNFGNPSRYNPDTGAISRDATQTTAGNQPAIVSNGVLVLENLKSALKLDGTDDDLDFDITLTGDFLIAYVGSFSSFTNAVLFGGTDDIKFTDSDTLVFSNGVTSTITMNSTLTVDTQYLITIQRVSNTITVYINGVAQTDTESNSGDFDFESIGNDSTNYLNGKPQEVIMFDTDKSADRTKIESNINRAYKIY